MAIAGDFFGKFPKIQYDLDIGQTVQLTNIVQSVDAEDIISSRTSYYTYYRIVDGERPDTISYKLYGSPNFHWTFFILNNDLRDGMSRAWPLSQQQFERMMEKEYDKYSVVSFYPYNETSNNGKSLSGLFQLTILSDEYLPFLELCNSSDTERAKILRFDTGMLQLIFSDIVRLTKDGAGNVTSRVPVSSRENFVSSASFKLVWTNPFPEFIKDEDENLVTNPDWVLNERLQDEWVEKMREIYIPIDEPGALLPPEEWLNDLPPDEFDKAVQSFKRGTIFQKSYTPAPRSYRWTGMRNAASEYYRIEHDERISITAYDSITNPNIVNPLYINFTEKEEQINSQKEQIKVVRKEHLSSFVSTYFKTLLS